MENKKVIDGATAAEMYLLGDWKIRRLLLRRIQNLTFKQRFTMILLACFADVCKIMWGKDWVREKLEGAPEVEQH